MHTSTERNNRRHAASLPSLLSLANAWRWIAGPLIVACVIPITLATCHSPARSPGSPPAAGERLPVFRLEEPRVDRGRAAAVLRALGRDEVPAREEGSYARDRADALVTRSGPMEVEILTASGGTFVRDVNQLWNPDARPELPTPEESRKIADRFLSNAYLLPAADRRVAVSFVGFSETGVADDGSESRSILDIQANYRTEILAGGRRFPVVGGGGDYKVAVGDGGRVIGMHGVWRPIRGVESEESVRLRTDAEAEVLENLSDLEIIRMESSLAYYSAPAFESQSFLAPVWVVRATVRIGDEEVPLRNTIVPATRFGPRRPEIVPAEREKGYRPPPSPSGDEEPRPEQRALWRRALEVLGQIVLLAPTSAWAEVNEAGTSWIGPSQNLSGSPANAKGFVDGLAAAGWAVNFNWGEGAAFESDWRGSDDTWVDAADFVFYTGHANSNGWVLNPPADTFLRFDEVGSTPCSPDDLYGEQDLEWIIVAACGPHQSNHFVPNVGNAFDRWRGIFDGLHAFLGYGAVTYDNTTEGSRVTELARSGWPIIDAWFRTAWEIQPTTNGYDAPNGPTIYVTAMYASSGGVTTRDDHIWGTGATVPDPACAGQQRTLMWSGT